MKLKKAVSALSALAITVSAFAGMAVTANAASEIVFSTDYTAAGALNDWVYDSGWEPTFTIAEGNGLKILAPTANGKARDFKAVKQLDELQSDGVIKINTSIQWMGNTSGNWGANIYTYFEVLDENKTSIINIGADGQNKKAMLDNQVYSSEETARGGLWDIELTVDTENQNVSYTVLSNENVIMQGTKTATFSNIAYLAVGNSATTKNSTLAGVEIKNVAVTKEVEDENIKLTDFTVNYSSNIGSIGSQDIDVSNKIIGDSVRYAVPKYVIKDSTLYEADHISDGNYYADECVTTSASETVDVSYEIKNVQGTPVYFNDFGSGVTDINNSTEYQRCSGGQTSTNNGEFVLVPAGTLSDGIYTIEIGHYKNRKPNVYAGEKLIGVCNTFANSNTYGTTTFENVEVKDGIAITATPGGSTYVDNMDYVLVVKTGDITPPEPVEPLVKKTVEKVAESTKLECSEAASYMAKFDITGSYEVKGVKWTVNGAGEYSESEPKTVDNIFENSTTITNGSIVFGLAIEAVDGLDTIGEVDAELQ